MCVFLCREQKTNTDKVHFTKYSLEDMYTDNNGGDIGNPNNQCCLFKQLNFKSLFAKGTETRKTQQTG
ncbi:unnamed protein product [Linum tenue]|uniref:Uncharacterized protein n=1 Tax=Linum tenue TaxID=586396 RepID=A0AAV0HBJ7_9ROSI|nr:unnamed protein product [Linum tenue]